MEAEEAKERIIRDHWHMYQEMDVGSVEEVGSFELEEIRVVFKEKAIARAARLRLESRKESGDMLGFKQFHRKSAVLQGLQHVESLIQLTRNLALDSV
jgi:hypothetical protein